MFTVQNSQKFTKKFTKSPKNCDKGHNEPTKLISAKLLDLLFVPLKHLVLVLLSTKIISFQVQIQHAIRSPGDEN